MVCKYLTYLQSTVMLEMQWILPAVSIWLVSHHFHWWGREKDRKITLEEYLVGIVNTLKGVSDWIGFCYVSESSCSNVQMGFCMETTGMTQGTQAEPPPYLEMEGESVESPEFLEETESMEDGNDPEVWDSSVFTASHFTELLLSF